MLNIPESDRAIAISIDGNGRRVACDPYLGTIEATLECAANLACTGAEPLGVTNCLNFGNPEKPAVAWQLDRAVTGLADACNALGLPVVGGNVSLYNETPSGPIYPTPVIGMVGELPDPEKAGGETWRPGDSIALLGPFNPSLAGSELEKLRGETGPGLPDFEIEPIAAAQATVREAIRSGKVRTAADISEGGVAATLAELAIRAGHGAEANLDTLMRLRECSAEDALFGEGPGGFILAGDRRELEALGGSGVELELIGTVSEESDSPQVQVTAAEQSVDLPLADAARAFDSLAARLAD